MPKNTKIEIWQKANTVCAGHESGNIDELFRVYEGPDAEENAKSFLNKPNNSMLYAKTTKAELEDEEGSGEENVVESYETLSVKELKAEIEARGLEIPDGAKKPVLIKILEDNDTE